MSWKDSLPASRAQKRYSCPGSHYLESLYPQETSASAEEGIQAHKIAAKILAYERFICCDPSELSDKYELLDLPDISTEMSEAILLYVNDVRREFPKGFTLYTGIEEKFFEHGGVTNISTSIIDFFLIRECGDDRQVLIWDFKYGHKNIEAFENWQLLNYAAAIVNTVLNKMADYKKTTFILKIIQPRVFNGDKIKIWELDEKDLLKYCEDVVGREMLSLTDNAPRFVSEECFTCRARHACPTLREASLNSIAISSGHSPYSLPAEEVGQELKILEHSKQVLDARINGLKQQALQYLKQGKRVNFYELQQAMSRLSWDASPQKLKGLEQLTGVSLLKQDFITPKQAIASGMPIDVVLKYASRKPGEIKIIPQSESQLIKIFNEEN